MEGRELASWGSRVTVTIMEVVVVGKTLVLELEP